MTANSPPLATWTFQGHTYVPLQMRYGFRQAIDEWGQPSSTVQPQLIQLLFDACDEQAALIQYMLDSYRRASSYYEQRYVQGGRVMRRLHLQAAYCVSYYGYFAPGAASPARWPSEVLTLELSAAALTVDGLTIENHSVLSWDAPEEVRRRARMMGDDPAYLALAAAMPAPKHIPKVEAPALLLPPTLTGNAEKGVYGEHISDTYMRAQGHVKLNDGGLVTPPPPGGTARGNGLDGVWKHGNPPPDYVITEAKYGSSRLGMTKDGRQMSDTWIQGSKRLDKAVGIDEAFEIEFAMRAGRVEKRLHQVSSNGQLTESILM